MGSRSGLRVLGSVLWLLTLCGGDVARADAAATSSPGAAAYLDCAVCHGADGGGVQDGSVPAIGGQPAKFIAAALEDFRAGRRQDLRMQHFADSQHLADDAAVAAVAVHVAGLRRVSPAGNGDGRAIARGSRLFAARCAACHGVSAEASERPPRPALAAQHAGYLRRKLLDGGITVAEARRHSVLARSIGADDVAAIADWLSRLPAP